MKLAGFSAASNGTLIDPFTKAHAVPVSGPAPGSPSVKGVAGVEPLWLPPPESAPSSEPAPDTAVH